MQVNTDVDYQSGKGRTSLRHTLQFNSPTSFPCLKTCPSPPASIWLSPPISTHLPTPTHIHLPLHTHACLHTHTLTHPHTHLHPHPPTPLSYSTHSISHTHIPLRPAHMHIYLHPHPSMSPACFYTHCRRKLLCCFEKCTTDRREQLQHQVNTVPWPVAEAGPAQPSSPVFPKLAHHLSL